MGHDSRAGADPEARRRYHELRQEDPYRASRFRYAMDNDPGPESDHVPPEWAALPESGPERESVTLTRPREATARSEEP